MALRGARPKPQLHIVAPGENPSEPTGDPARDTSPGYDNGILPPVKLKSKREKELWDIYIRPASWLTQYDALRAYMFIQEWMKYEANPKGAPANLKVHLRNMMNELCLDATSRMRMKPHNKSKKAKAQAEAEDGTKSKASKFFE